MNDIIWKSLCTLGVRKVKVMLQFGVPIFLDPCDPVQRDILIDRIREPWFTSALIASIRFYKPKVIIDVGAHIGYYVALYHAMYRENLKRGILSPCKIFVIEPSPRSLKLLKENLDLLKEEIPGPNHYLFPIALGKGNEAEGSKIQLLPGKTSNLDSIAPTVHEYDKKMRLFSNEIFWVPLSSLDQLFNKGLLSCPDLIRMDVEGYEKKVLEGASSLLTECRPVLAIEVHRKSLNRYGDSAKSLMEYLERKSYKIAYLEWGPKTIQALKRKNSRYYYAYIFKPPKTPQAITSFLREGSALLAVPL